MDPNPNSDIRILLADPDEASRMAARRALEREGFAVAAAGDGAEALARFAPDLFDLVIANVLMPRRDGLEVLRQVRKQSPETQVVLLTDPGSIGSAALGLREGAFAYLLKPIGDFYQLVHTVRMAVDLQQLRRRLAGLAPKGASPVPEYLPTLLASQRLAESMRAGSPLPETLQVLLQSSAVLFSAPHGAVLLSRAGASLQLEAVFGYPDASSGAGDYVQAVGDAFAWRVASDRRTLIDAVGGGGHAIATPLIANNELQGVLIVYPVRLDDVNPDRIALFETLAALGSVAVERAHLVEENRRLSTFDPLTGVFKRTTFLDLADREFRRSWRLEQPLTAMIIDVDSMHEINARSGTHVGDEVLLRVATACRNTIRSFDLIGRYDEDALALLLIMTDRIGARGAAERLRLAVSSIDLTDATGPIHITTCIGACTYPREGCASIFDLLDLAQTAQRSARRSGINQAFFA